MLDDVGDLLSKHWYALGPRARQMADLALVLSRLAVMNETPAASSAAAAGADERFAFQDVN